MLARKQSKKWVNLFKPYWASPVRVNKNGKNSATRCDK